MAISIKLKDILALSDKLKIQLALLQNKVQLSDQISLGDGFKLIEQGIQVSILADSLTLLDVVVTTQQNKSGSINSDSILISDSLSLLLIPLLSLADGLGLSDTLKTQTGFGFSFSDSLSFSDSAGLQIIENILLSLSDSLTLSDLLNNSPSSALDDYFRRYLNDIG